MPASEISSFGIDADNNRYFLDSANGTVLRVASDGTRSTILSGLKPGNTQTSLVVDYRGNLFVADPGNSRIVSLPAGSATPITRATSSAHSLAVDTTGNCFYLSGSQLYRIPPVGDPRPVGSIPGAALIAYGPASSNPALAEDDTIYVLGSPTAAHAYTVSTFTYHNSAGTIAVDRTFTSTDPVSSFVVDSNRNLILSTTAASTGSLVQIAPSGKATPFTTTPAGVGPYLALDYNRTLYYLDGSGLFSLTTGPVDFGGVLGSFGGGSFSSSRELVIAVAPGTSIATFEQGDFVDDFDPSSSCTQQGLCHINVSFLPSNLGLESGTFLVQDQAGNTLASVPLYGNGLFPLHNMFQANGAISSTPLGSVPYSPEQQVKSAVGLSAINSNVPVLVTDAGTGSLVSIFQPLPPITNLGKPQTFAQYPAGQTYVTQANLPGILLIAPDGTRSRVAQRLVSQPKDVAVDDIGNLYIAGHDSVYRVGIDGTETPLAAPENDGGYGRVESIAVDGPGNLTVYFGAGGPSGSGGLLKISPAGALTPLAIPEKVRSGTAMALDSGGALYISDGLSHTLSTVRTDGSTLNLISGLKVPKGVSGYAWPAVIDQGTNAYVQPALPNSAFDFGSVPVGTSVTRTYTLIAAGNQPTTVDFFFGPDTQFAISTPQLNIAPGGSAQFTITYKPTKAGPYATDLVTSSNDFNLPDGSPSFISLTGTGIAAK